MPDIQRPDIQVSDLAGVVYSSGKVFDGLSTGRLDTENFLRSGSLDGISSRSDLALLQDLRDASQFIIDHRVEAIDASYVQAVNGALTRSGAIHPGRLRTHDQHIGVGTRYGRHAPDAINQEMLQTIVERARVPHDPQREALHLFVELAKAQPFEDGNKRTALLVANSVLIRQPAVKVLTIPVDEDDPSLADRFNDALARAYVFDERRDVLTLLHDQGLRSLDRRGL